LLLGDCGFKEILITVTRNFGLVRRNCLRSGASSSVAALRAATAAGLDWAIVSRIVADHHGWFTLESELGAGTVATVGLPVADDEG
jgi:hypothetical protein